MKNALLAGPFSSAWIEDEYRYTLTRYWGEPPACTFIMLNPSTADTRTDDPTIRKCVSYAKRWGYGGLVVANVFALRATDPKQLETHPNPIGPKNEEALMMAIEESPRVVCAWGNKIPFKHREWLGKVVKVLRNRQRLFVLGMNKPQRVSAAISFLGQPKHPLYLKNDLQPVEWNP